MSLAQAKDAEPNPFGEPITTDFLDEVENRPLVNAPNAAGFWNASPQLQQIAWTAAQEEASAWGLLATCLVHQLSYIPATVVLVKKSGAKGKLLSDGTSLNLFTGLTADTGGNKSAIFREASSLIPLAEQAIADGTGQGIMKSFAETTKVTHDENKKRLSEPHYITQYFTNSIVMHAPEIDSLNAEFVREGSKTASMMRSIWVGEIVGSTTGDITRRVTLIPQTYRFGGVWGVQPAHATKLLEEDEIKGGTPQRWVWAPTEEFRDALTRTPPPSNTEFPLPAFATGTNIYGVSNGELPTVIELSRGRPINQQLPDPIWVEWSPQMRVDIPMMRAKLKRTGQPYAKRTTEEMEERKARLMESHLVLAQIKVAAAIGFLHGRVAPSNLDWELAGSVIEVSRRELAGVWQCVQEAITIAAANKGKVRGGEMHAMDHERNRLLDGDDYEFANDLWKKLSKSPMTTTALNKGLSSTRRKRLKPALDVLESQGRYVQGANGLHWAVKNGNILPANMAAQFQ